MSTDVPAMVEIGRSNRGKRGIRIAPGISIEMSTMEFLPGDVAIAVLGVPLLVPAVARMGQSHVPPIQAGSRDGDRRVRSDCGSSIGRRRMMIVLGDRRVP